MVGKFTFLCLDWGRIRVGRTPLPKFLSSRDTWARKLQHLQHTTHKSSRRESRQEVKNTATSYDISPHHTHSVNTTYRRFFEAESARFLICKHNTSCCSNTSPPTTFWHHGWRPFSLGNSKHVENERRSSGKTSIHSENLGNQSVRPVRFWYKNANVLFTVTPCGLVQFQPITWWGPSRGTFTRGIKVKCPILHWLARSRTYDVGYTARKHTRIKASRSAKQNHGLQPRLFVRNGPMS